MENHTDVAPWPIPTYDALEDEIKHLRLRIKELENKTPYLKFEVNGEELVFTLEKSYGQNLAIVCQGNYLVGITPKGKLIRYIQYIDTFPLNKECRIKIRKDKD